jgi:flagellar motor switch protein FliG
MKKLLLLIILANTFSFVNAVDFSSVLTYQKRMEENIQKIIDNYIGKSKVIVNVNITLKDQELKKQLISQEKNQKNIIPDNNDESLPGYSLLNKNESNFSMESILESTEILPSQVIDKRIINLVVDNSVSSEEIEKIKDIISQIVKIDSTNGDVIEVIQLDLSKSLSQNDLNSKSLLSTLISSDFIKLYITIFAILLIVIIILFFIYLYLSKVMNKINYSNEKSSVSKNNKDNDEDILDIDFMNSKNQYINKEKKDNGGMFGFVNENNLTKVAYLLQYANLQQKVAIINFIEPNLSALLLQILPSEDQKKIIMQLSKEFILSQKEVKEFALEMKNHIEYLAGGKNFTYNMFDYLNNDIRNNIISELEKENQELAKDISENIYIFEDIQYLEKRYLQFIVKKLGFKEFSITLSDSSEEFKNIILSAIPEGMSEMIKQSLDLQQKQPKSKISEEQHKVVQIMRSLNQEGLIPKKSELIQGTKTS